MMNLMSALLKTYDFALANDLVDNHYLSNTGHVLLPIYHSNRRSTGEDIFEITIDEDSESISGGFLERDKVIIFPITEDSIIRAGSKIAPHAICDELSYLASKIDKDKNEEYLKGIQELLEFEKVHNNENFRIIGEYIRKETILEDFLKFFLKNKEYSIDNKNILTFEELESNGNIRTRKVDLKKIFITFKVNRLMESDITISMDTNLHRFYIDFINNKNNSRVNINYCDITGKLDYCIERHRGLIGNAKLIGISNNNETYYGRLKQGKDIYHISFEASQKVHNMLKFFLDSDKYKSYIGENAYLINWLSQDLNKGGVELVSDIDFDDDEAEDATHADFGDLVSRQLGRYFTGEGNELDSKGDFYILIIEKISNGRVSMKYFRRLSRSEAYERVKDWYDSTEWRFYNPRMGKVVNKSPSIRELVNFLYGGEDSNGYLSCENSKLSRSSIERLIPCIIDGKRIPKDIIRAAYHKLSNKRSYKKSWNRALNIGCSLIKKDKYDYQDVKIYFEKIGEVEILKGSRSFYYGRLIAIYEKIELDAIRGRESRDTGREQGQRITNADRLWSSMIRTPERTRFILETKIKPYTNILKRSNPGSYVFYDRMITEITLDISNLVGEKNISGALNEDFILGYYYQKDSFYNKREDE